MWEQVWVVILCCGVEVAENLSEVPLFGAFAPQPAQLHQNHKPILARDTVNGENIFYKNKKSKELVEVH